jgi:phage terminase small subunit
VAIKANQGRLEDDWRMSPKQAAFVAEYLKDLNATQAAIRAGYSETWANKNAHRLTVTDGIQRAIRSARERLFEAQLMSTLEAQALTAEIARFDIGTIQDDRGNLKPISEWPEAARRVVAGVEVIIKNAEAGDGVTDRVLKLKLPDRNKALDMIHRIHGAYAADKLEVSGEIATVEKRLIEARKRAAARKGEA